MRTGSATFSECGLYRYELVRDWSQPGHPDLFAVMEPVKPRTLGLFQLNPSTADGTRDDPTVRKDLFYAECWGFNRLLLGNLFAYRATDPAELVAAAAAGADVVGPDNDRYILGIAQEADMVLCAWGVHGGLRGRGHQVAHLLADAGIKLHYLKLNKDGSPAHTLYLSGELTPTPWTP